MAKTTSKTFSILALLITVFIIGTAAAIYFQSLSGGGSNTALAALSQAMPSRAASAAAGSPQGFEQLDEDAKRLQRLISEAGSSLPGSRGQWEALQQSADALLAKRADAQSMGLAIAFLEQLSARLADQGLIYVEVPSIHSVCSVFDWDLLKYFQNAHVVHYTTSSLNNLLHLSGLTCVKIDDQICSLSQRAEKNGSWQPCFDQNLAELKSIESAHRRLGPLIIIKRTARTLATQVLETLNLKQFVRKIVRGY